MFATSSRSRRHMQFAERGNMTVEPPLPGSDSCFGVRSLNGSVEWSTHGLEVGQADGGITDGLPEAGSTSGDIIDEGEAGTKNELKVAAEESIISQPMGLSPSQPAEQSDKSPRPSVQHILVPSPTLFLPTLSTSSPPASSSIRYFELQDPDHLLFEHSTDDDGDAASSAPPSPTSLNSLPSYLASDISMPSSPGIGYSTGPGSAAGRSNSRSPLRTGSGRVGAALQALERERARSTGTIRRPSKYISAQKGSEEDEEEAPDLVIPTLSLPSSSLHLSLRPFRGKVEGIKIALVGGEEEGKAFLRALEAQEELVEVDRTKGWIGIMRGGELVMVLMTGLSVIQIKHRILKSYSALNDLLNPAATKGDQPRLRDMISRYADREDWIHGCLYLDEYTPPSDLATLVYAIPSMTQSQPLAETSFLSTRASTPSPPAPRMDDPTPMARTESLSYFSQPIATHRPASPIFEDPPGTSPSISAAVSALQAHLDGDQIRSASIDHFLAWRPAPANLESSHSSIDTTSAGTSGAGGLDREAPMPTVARAQGGGEWEAGLSRRMAKRRDTVSGRRAILDTSGKRRRSKGMVSRPVPDDLPLFPTSKRPDNRNSSSRPAGLGVKDLLERTFAPMKKGLVGWRGVVLVAAVVGVVGLGWWFGRKS